MGAGHTKSVRATIGAQSARNQCTPTQLSSLEMLWVTPRGGVKFCTSSGTYGQGGNRAGGSGIHALRLGKVRHKCRIFSARRRPVVAAPMASLAMAATWVPANPRVLRANQAALHALRALRLAHASLAPAPRPPIGWCAGLPSSALLSLATHTNTCREGERSTRPPLLYGAR